MKWPGKNSKEGLKGLSRREQVILLSLLVLVMVFAFDFLFNGLYLERRRELSESVAAAEAEVAYFHRLMSRQEVIHARYLKLESPGITVQDSVLTDTEVLRELASLADRSVHVKSIVPRLGQHEGRQVMFVALDFEGPFQSAVDYMEKILFEMPSEVGSLSLAPGSAGGGSVICRMTLRVEYLES